MPEVRYTDAAVRALSRLNRSDPKAVHALREKIGTYAANPAASHAWIRPLTGEDGVRLRQGDYRAVLVVDEGPPVVIDVVKVGHRKDVYK